MKKVLFIVALLSIVAIGVVSGSECIKKGTGTLVLQITDKPPSELNITHAWVTISSVEVHSIILCENGTFGKFFKNFLNKKDISLSTHGLWEVMGKI